MDCNREDKYMKILRKCLIIALSLLLVSCTGSNNSPSSSLDAYIKGQIDGIKKEIVKEIQNNDEVFSNDQLEEIGLLLTDFTYQIKNEKIRGDEASCDITINSYDFANLIKSFFTKTLSQVFSSALSGENIDSYENTLEKIATDVWNECLQDTKTKGRTVSKTITIHLHKTESGWEVDAEECRKEFTNAITGGLACTIEEMSNSLEKYIQ